MEGNAWDVVNNPSPTAEELKVLPEGVARLAKENGDIQAVDKSTYSYKCNVCGDGKKPFSGLQPLQDHLNGKAHKKMKRLIEMSKATQIGASSNSSTQNALLPDSTNSALSPEIQKLIENETVKMLETNGVVSFQCLVCNVPLTDVTPVKQHIDGKQHLKKMKPKRVLVPDSQGIPQPSEDMEWNNTDSSQTQEPNQYQASPEIPKIIYPASPMLSDSDTYKNLTTPRGLVCIFNNTFYGMGRGFERKGSRQDTKNLRLLFHNMGYKVRCYEDLSKSATLEKLAEIQNEPELNDVDSLIVVIMSHGDPKDERKFLCNDLESIELDEVRYRFTASQCKALFGKAKIFLSNYCRGVISEVPVKLEKPAKLESDAPINYNGRDAPRNMCTIHASISGFEAKRHPQKGTIFAQSLCKVFSQLSHNTEMADLYRALCREMTEVTTPEQQNYFFLRFYFNPTPPVIPLPEITP